MAFASQLWLPKLGNPELVDSRKCHEKFMHRVHIMLDSLESYCASSPIKTLMQPTGTVWPSLGKLAWYSLSSTPLYLQKRELLQQSGLHTVFIHNWLDFLESCHTTLLWVQVDLNTKRNVYSATALRTCTWMLCRNVIAPWSKSQAHCLSNLTWQCMI